MERPKNLEVADALRAKKLLLSPLWDINPRNWNENHYKEWESILTGVTIKEVKADNPRLNLHNKVKVIRLSDNTIFDSIGDCKKKEGIHGILMRSLLKEGIKYKKVI